MPAYSVNIHSVGGSIVDRNNLLDLLVSSVFNGGEQLATAEELSPFNSSMCASGSNSFDFVCVSSQIRGLSCLNVDAHHQCQRRQLLLNMEPAHDLDRLASGQQLFIASLLKTRGPNRS